MCGRYAVTLPPEAMRDLFRYLNSIDFPPRYNIAPTQPILAVLVEHGRRTAKLLRWGLVPWWVKDPRGFPLLVNARAEGISTKPAFRDALKNQRCIVPASGYYEWMVGPDKQKIPFYITRRDGQPMAFAGLYATWSGPQGEEIDTAAICTTAAGPDTAAIHERQPVILEGQAIEDWLDTGAIHAAKAEQLLLPLPAGHVQAIPVSNRVNSNRNDGPELIVPLTAPEAIAATAETPRKKKAAAGAQLDLF
jgi:putative SOS response-associated peptidase YedK